MNIRAQRVLCIGLLCCAWLTSCEVTVYHRADYVERRYRVSISRCHCPHAPQTDTAGQP